MTAKLTRLVVADDHAMFRAGLKHLLEERGQGYAIVAEAATGRQAVQVARQTKPDMVVIDFSMPELNGIEAMGQILRAAPQTKVLLLSMHRHELYVLQALRQGACGYVVKDSAFDDLVAALQAALQGRIYVSPSVLTPAIRSYLAHRDTPPRQLPTETLTPRERQLFELIAGGQSTKVIAGTLGISVKTAETHRAHLMRKLNAHNVAEVVHAAVQWGVIQL